MIDPRKPNFLDTPGAPSRPRFDYAPAQRPATTEPPQPPAATVITPYFNTGPVFHETAACVLGQSLQNFEWIIVNDASTSAEALGTLAEYRERSRTDPRIRVIDHRVNRGLSASRNTGFRMARSEYVFQLDADDLIEPTTLEKCLWFLHSNPEHAFAHGYSVGFQGQEYLWERGFHEEEGFLQENLVTATGMVRRSAHAAVGGYDESIRGGMEDWDFWLRCAAAGHWGGTIPEYLDWYRRRPGQHDDWANLKSDENRRRFRAIVRGRYPALFEGGFPRLRPRWHMPFSSFPDRTHFRNPLEKRTPRVLLVAPWLRLGGADRFNMDLLRFLTERLPELAGERPELAASLPEGWLGRWEMTVATTVAGHPWLPEFSRHTPDVFCLSHFCHPTEVPLALRHLIESRRPDVVIMTNAELGYHSLAYLRAHCPWPVYMDFNHMEEEHWKNGGHPRYGAGFQEQLDVSAVVSGHLRTWMGRRGADESRIEVCHINADTTRWRPDEEARGGTRESLGIAPDARVILYAARLCAQKQPHVFARTMRLVADEMPDVIALVAGDGEQQGELERLLDELSLRDNVRMLGPVAADDMPGVMAASDVFFLPSLWEGIALSIYEAMASGLAVVGADVGGQTELVTPESGVLLKRPTAEEGGAAKEAANYCEVLLQLLNDPQRRALLGKAARKRILEHFELDSMGLRMLRIFARGQEWKRTAPRVNIPTRLAKEMAVQGIECVRIHELADYLWPYRERWIEHEGRSSRERLESDARTRRELDELEGSRAWQLVLKLKRVPPYPIVARLRYGPNWAEQLPANPAVRLHHIRASRAYKVISRVKDSSAWRLIKGDSIDGGRG